MIEHNSYGDADGGYPRHLFGHTAFEQPYRCKNKFGIDTSGVYGNLFTYYRSGKMLSIPASATYSENKLIEVVDADFDLDELEHGERRRIEIAIADKINFVSGTIAPCASDTDRMRIEPIEYNPFDILKIVNVDGSERLFRDTPVDVSTSRLSFSLTKARRTQSFKNIIAPLLCVLCVFVRDIKYFFFFHLRVTVTSFVSPSFIFTERFPWR